MKVRELEGELDSEQRRHAETQKNMRKADRRLKEIAFQSDEDRKNQERLNEMIDKLNGKLKTYKRQVEEAVSNKIIQAHRKFRRNNITIFVA
jgi:uncharacterized FlaG/YvyC family protein